MLSLEVKRTEADVMQSVRKNRSSNGHLALQNQEKHRNQQGHRKICRDTERPPTVSQQSGGGKSKGIVEIIQKSIFLMQIYKYG